MIDDKITHTQKNVFFTTLSENSAPEAGRQNFLCLSGPAESLSQWYRPYALWINFAYINKKMASCGLALCCAGLCCAGLCCAVLCCAVLCCAVLCCVSTQYSHDTVLLSVWGNGQDVCRPLQFGFITLCCVTLLVLCLVILPHVADQSPQLFHEHVTYLQGPEFKYNKD